MPIGFPDSTTISACFFSELMTLDGDIGARHLLSKHGEAVAEVPVEGDSAFLDIDTPQALETARRG